MDRIRRINEAGTAYLIAETDFSSLRFMGGVGRKLREARERAQAARAHLAEVFRESGYTLEELAGMRRPDGTSALEYGILDVLKQTV